MVPIAWICLVLVICLYAVFVYSELRTRAKSHVKGCPSLPYLSQRSFDSLTIIEPDLLIVELTHDASLPKRHIPDAHPVTLARLEEFLAGVPQKSVFVFYSAEDGAIDWPEVERIVNRLALPNVNVLRRGLEGWLKKHPAAGLATAS
jgi:hypothetical protein